MKKKIAMAMALVLALGVITGCAASSNTEASADASAEASTGAVTVADYDPADYVTLGDYKNIEVTTNEYTVSDEAVDSYVENILSSYAEHELLDKSVVEDGDYIAVDYTLIQDQETKDSGTDMYFTVGAGQMIDDFDQAMPGKNIGEEFTFDASFPEDYWSEDLAGQTVQFTVTVTGIYSEETVTPELTDEWVDATFGASYGLSDVDSLKAYVKNYLVQQASDQQATDLSKAIENAVYEVCTVNGLPDGLVEEYTNTYLEAVRTQAEGYGYTYEEYLASGGYESEEAFVAALTPDVEEYLGQMLIRKAIFQAENMVLSDEEVDSYLEAYAQYYGCESLDAFIEAYGSSYGFSDKEGFIEYAGGRSALEDAILGEKLWSNIKEGATVNYVETPYSE